uniref:BtpA/SgcQ family protein n=1 Tax=Ndongobacter massiliensis TaxID=1871025 RepID=UPI000931F66A|nr:BtpA/SgcQ family protein [Ndongobacter massiliensis]
MAKNWLTEIWGEDKIAIGLVHLLALPGDPLYDPEGGMEKIYEAALQDIEALQKGGIDGIHFSNEFSFPYELNPPREIISAMAYLMGRLREKITVPYGANVISNPADSIALCATTGALWTRGAFSGVYSGNMGLQNAEIGKYVRLRHNLHADRVRMVHYVVPESSLDIGGRDPLASAKAAQFNNMPDAFAVPGATAGKTADMGLLHSLRECMPDMVLFASTGVKKETVEEVFTTADAAFIATSLKKDGIFENPVDENRVGDFMETLKHFRSKKRG